MSGERYFGQGIRQFIMYSRRVLTMVYFMAGWIESIGSRLRTCVSNPTSFIFLLNLLKPCITVQGNLLLEVTIYVDHKFHKSMLHLNDTTVKILNNQVENKLIILAFALLQ